MILHHGLLRYSVEDHELEGSLGETDYARHIIKIDTRVTDQARQLTLVHEALHAFCPWLEEKEVEQLTGPVFALISENHEFTDYIQARQ